MAGAGDIRAGGAYVELYGKKDQLGKDLKDSKSSVKQWASDITSLGAGFSALGAAITAPFALAAKSFADQGSLLDDISQRTGVSVEALGGLKYAAELTGTGIEDLTAGLRKMAQTVDGARNGQTTAIDTLTRLGLTVGQLKGLKPEEIFSVMADRIGRIPDPIERSAVAMDVFGKSGGNLIPLMSLGSSGIAQLRKEAEQLGLVMSGEDVKAAAEFGDSIDRTWAAVRGFAITIGGALAPALQAGADLFVAVSKPVRDFITDNKELVIAVALTGAGILATGAALTGLGLTLTLLTTAGAGLAALGSVLAAVALNPVTWLVAAGAAAVGVIAYVTGAFDAAVALFGKVTRGAVSTVQGVANALRAGKIEVTWAIVGAALQIAWLTTVNYLKNIWREFALYIGSALTAPLKAVSGQLAAFARDIRNATGVDVGVAEIEDIDRGLRSGDKKARADADKARKKDEADLKAAQLVFQALVDSVKPPELPTVVKDIPETVQQSLLHSGSTSGDAKSDNIVSATSSRAALGIAGNATSRMVKAAEETAKNTKKIADAPPLVFGV